MSCIICRDAHLGRVTKYLANKVLNLAECIIISFLDLMIAQCHGSNRDRVRRFMVDSTYSFATIQCTLSFYDCPSKYPPHGDVPSSIGIVLLRRRYSQNDRYFSILKPICGPQITARVCSPLSCLHDALFEIRPGGFFDYFPSVTQQFLYPRKRMLLIGPLNCFN